MARRPRYDAPRQLHHVFGRAVSRRTMFETRRDIRYMLSLLAREVRAGRIEIIAYCFLTTHYHLLIRSTTGELSRVMQRVLNCYVRRFNRTHRRDGPLPRSRFQSRPVRSESYLHTLVRYIDLNATKARLSSRVERYPYGSAMHYCAPRRPPWLHAEELDQRIGNPAPGDRAVRYLAVFGHTLTPWEKGIVETRITRAPSSGEELDSLVNAAPPAVRDWMIRKAKLADNTKPGEAYADVRVIIDSVNEEKAKREDLPVVSPSGQRVSAWPLLQIGILRDLGGLSLIEISKRIGLGPSSVGRRLEEHRRQLIKDPAYAMAVAVVVRRALDKQWKARA